MSLTVAVAMLASGFIVALGPSLSSILVAARSSALGVSHGTYAAAGVVAGDLLLLTAAISGLTAGAAWFAQTDVIIQYVGGGFLIWLGGRSLATDPLSEARQLNTPDSSLTASFAAGLLLTLADLKAIAFYLAFLPAFIDLQSATRLNLLGIAGIITVSVGSAKLVWVFTGARSAWALPPSVRTLLQRLGGGLLVAVGLFLMLGLHRLNSE